MHVFGEWLSHHGTVDEYAHDRGDHIEGVEAVESVRDDEHIRGKRGRGRALYAEAHYDVGECAAEGSIKERCVESSEREVVGDELRGGGEDAHEAVNHSVIVRVERGTRGSYEKSEREEECVESDDSAGAVLVMLRGAEE